LAIAGRAPEWLPFANFVRLDVSDSQGPVTELSAGDLQVFAGTP
jgi:hypothetical protein